MEIGVLQRRRSIRNNAARGSLWLGRSALAGEGSRSAFLSFISPRGGLMKIAQKTIVIGLTVSLLQALTFAQEPIRIAPASVSPLVLSKPPAQQTDVAAAAGLCPVGEIADCNGNCVPEHWVGDSLCDNGAFVWPETGGVPIFLNCDEFACDGGDCVGPPCTTTPGTGNIYSVNNMIGEPQPNTTICYRTTDPNLPGEPDDNVKFDGISENLATDVVGTVASVIESQTSNPDGTVNISIWASSPTQTDLFPGGFTSPDTGLPLTDICWFVGLDQPLDWIPAPTVISATITVTQDGAIIAGPEDVGPAGFFTVPWDGFFGVALPGGAGMLINGFHLELVVTGAGTCGDGLCDGLETSASCPADCEGSPGDCPGTGDCCAANGSIGCTDADCCATVCAVDPFCCTDMWDDICAEEAGLFCCESCPLSPPCPIDCPGVGDCCQVHETLGCGEDTCCSAVCAVDPFCCTFEWDAFCVSRAADLCGEMCPTGACCLDSSCPAPGSCETVVFCAPNCACFEVAEGGGHCAAAVDCAQTVACPNGTSECPAGQLCYLNSCCTGPVCLPECSAGAQRGAQDDGRSTSIGRAISAAERGSTSSCLDNAEGFCTAVLGEYQGDGTLCADAGVCSCPAAPANLIGSSYACGDSLSRAGRNVLRFEFDAPIEPPMPGEIEIRELLPGGSFGLDDLSPLFQFSVEGDNVLRVEEHGCTDGTCDFGAGTATCLDGPDAGKPCIHPLANETWYGLMNLGGWCETAEFQMNYVVVLGDANNDLVTSFADLSAINSMMSEPANTPDDSRFDINITGGVGFADLSAANSFNGSSALNSKPDRHTCTLP